MPNVVTTAGVGGSILDFFNKRKAKEQQKQLDENVKLSTLVTKELRNSLMLDFEVQFLTSSNMRKAKEKQKQLDENVKSLTVVTEELRNEIGHLGA
ncbi:unnamed protein product [Prunus armeniaca]|uniref:Uncharacterized protein n=1 Tax=Prunus armeniaca TaxID=36596 RepID=A0A6J5W4Q1_PRUAR|nr:unnamed protein product [Prunus armeniaca]